MESHTHSTLAAAAVLGIVSLLFLYIRSLAQWRARTRGLPFPPGPKPLPIVGNLFDMPKTYPWVAYRDLCAQYGEYYLCRTSFSLSYFVCMLLGDIVHLRSFGKSTVVLGSAEVVQEYLGKRAANTSDRDRSPMIEL